MIWLEEPNNIKSKAAVFALHWPNSNLIYIARSTNAVVLYKQYIANLKSNKAPYHLQQAYKKLGIPLFKYLYRTLDNDLEINYKRLKKLYHANLLENNL